MSLVYGDGRVAVYHCDHAQLAEIVKAAGGCDAVIVDAPYSKRTHEGHGTAVPRGGPTPPCYDGSDRRDISYASWSHDAVESFVETWTPVVRGWFVSMTDDVLFPTWRAALGSAGLTTFNDVPAVVRGMSVRLAGDGPSSWAIHCAVARPKSLLRWGTLDGAYGPGPREKQSWVGGKPLWLMSALVHDYTRRDDLVVDPCCGAGTTAIAAMRDGRRAIVGDRDEKAVATTVERVRAEVDRAAAIGRQVARWSGPEHPIRRAKQSALALDAPVSIDPTEPFG